MKKVIFMLFFLALGFGLVAHAADVDAKEPTKQVQVKKLRVQAEQAHKKGDTLTARADKLESEAKAQPEEKMRGGRCDQHPIPPRRDGEAACGVQR